MDNLYRNDNIELPVLQPWVCISKPSASRLIFKRNAFFHRVDPKGKQLPYTDSFVFTIANNKLIPAKTGTGEVDLQARYLRFDDYTFLKKGEERSPYSTRLWKTAKGAHLALFPNLNVNNPILTLYRGNTYKFNVDAKGHPFWIMTEPYKSKVSVDGSTSTIFDTGVTNNGADQGTVTFTVPTAGAPDTLYYQCGNHDIMYGILQIKDASTTTAINVENDIIGVKNYSLRTLDLSNGMKIKFKNSLVGTNYQDKEYYVEGVGDAITLTDVEDLITPGSYATESTVLVPRAKYASLTDW